jgi:hypothetical protein
MRRFLIGLVFFLALTGFAWGQSFTTYVASSPTIFAWDDPNTPKATSYQVTFIRNVTGEKFIFNSGTSQISVASEAVDAGGKKLKSGVYEVQVVCINSQGTSTACSSLDAKCAKLKDGTAGSWKAFYKPQAPGAPHFNP